MVSAFFRKPENDNKNLAEQWTTADIDYRLYVWGRLYQQTWAIKGLFLEQIVDKSFGVTIRAILAPVIARKKVT